MVPAMDQPRSASLVALRDRREQVIEWLSDQFARDALELDEYERRIDLGGISLDFREALLAPGSRTSMSSR